MLQCSYAIVISEPELPTSLACGGCRRMRHRKPIMSDQIQSSDATLPQRREPPAERLRSVEAGPDMSPASITAERMHVDAYQFTGDGQTRGWALALMTDTERRARMLPGGAPLHMPDSTGLVSQTAGENGADFTYSPEAREDRLSRLTRTRTNNGELVTRYFAGRPDHLLRERHLTNKDWRGLERSYDGTKTPLGLKREAHLRNGRVEGFDKLFEPGRHPDGMIRHSFRKEHDATVDSRWFADRSDRLRFVRRTTTGGKENLERQYDNIELPPLKKGWGPYQALEALKSEGKINMSAKEMLEHARRIRDRELAASGRTYFKAGEKLSLYSADEMNGGIPTRGQRERNKKEKRPSTDDVAPRSEPRRRLKQLPPEQDAPPERRERPRRRELPQRRDASPREEAPEKVRPTGRVVREAADRSRFYRHQDDGVSCSAFSMAMMASDHMLGRPIRYGDEAYQFKKLAGVTRHGYRGSLETMADQLRSIGLEARAYQYRRFGQQGMADLNRELDQGHGVVARVVNPRTGNRHYIYVAGRTADGDYIVGDPDRGNRSHMSPVSPEALFRMMSKRDGFVAGWSPPEKSRSDLPESPRYRRARPRR